MVICVYIYIYIYIYIYTHKNAPTRVVLLRGFARFHQLSAS